MLFSRFETIRDVLPLAALRAGTIAFSALLGACASGQSGTSAPTARLTAPPGTEIAVDIEKDGIAAQTPPLLERRQTPDNPSEPFSPNYGRKPASIMPVSDPALRDDLPWLQKQKRMSALVE